LSGTRHLLDVNVALALFDSGHIHHRLVALWFTDPDLQWGLCGFSEAGFLRVSSNPAVGNWSLKQATDVLKTFTNDPNYRYWPISEEWASLIAPIASQIFGHQQIADAYLLGLAIKESGVLVTLDKAFRQLAGPRYSENLLVLE
jgi:toxin-antitoxin system PIN domain toxin